jgi:hypothetical protein
MSALIEPSFYKVNRPPRRFSSARRSLLLHRCLLTRQAPHSRRPLPKIMRLCLLTSIELNFSQLRPFRRYRPPNLSLKFYRAEKQGSRVVSDDRSSPPVTRPCSRPYCRSILFTSAFPPSFWDGDSLRELEYVKRVTPSICHGVSTSDRRTSSLSPAPVTESDAVKGQAKASRGEYGGHF